MGSEFEIRPAVRSDWEAILDIYNHYVEGSSCTFDKVRFSLEERKPWFEAFANSSGRYVLLVACKEGEVHGYACSQQFRAKQAYETSVEVSVYLAHNLQGRGIAKSLYDSLFDAVSGADVHRAYGIITLPNDRSIALHEKNGFKKIGVFSEVGRKFGKYWDVAWYEKKLS